MKHCTHILAVILALLMAFGGLTASAQIAPEISVRGAADGEYVVSKSVQLNLRGEGAKAELRVNRPGAVWSAISGGTHVQLTQAGATCIVRATAQGRAVICAAFPGGEARIAVRVADEDAGFRIQPKAGGFVTSISLNKKSTRIQNRFGAPGTVQLRATPKPLSAANRAVTWTSEDSTIAKVDDNGLVTAVGEGKVRIVASADDQNGLVKAACMVTVAAVRVSKAFISESIVYLDHTNAAEGSVKLTTSVKPANATFQTPAWSSADPGIASVDGSGVVAGRSAGLTTITATLDNGRKSVSCDVRVRDKSAMKRVVVTAGGDFSIGGDPEAGTMKRFADILSGKILGDGTVHEPDYTYPVKRARELFAQDDLTIVNLEMVLTNRTTPRSGDKSFNLRGKPEYAQILKEGSIEVANLVNNKMKNYGDDGYRDTREAVRKVGVTAIGFNNVDNAETVTLANGVKVGFLSYMPMQGLGADKSNDAIKSRVRKAKRENDIVIVQFHFTDMTILRQQRVKAPQVNAARSAVEGGADLVVGHHTHLISGIEKYKGRYIAYGLGSLISTGDQAMLDTFVIRQTFLVGQDSSGTFVETPAPTVYPGCVSSAPKTTKKNRLNNCQPYFFDKNTEADRYNRVIKTIKKYSKWGNNMVAADFIEG